MWRPGLFTVSISEDTLSINGVPINIPANLNCKSKNVIYLWTCTLCGEKETYFGRTTQHCNNRTSGHRTSFTESKYEKSALSMHAREVHGTHFSLDIFNVAVVKKVSPQILRREEFRYIDKYKTAGSGLNRYKS